MVTLRFDTAKEDSSATGAAFGVFLAGTNSAADVDSALVPTNTEPARQNTKLSASLFCCCQRRLKLLLAMTNGHTANARDEPIMQIIQPQAPKCYTPLQFRVGSTHTHTHTHLSPGTCHWYCKWERQRNACCHHNTAFALDMRTSHRACKLRQSDIDNGHPHLPDQMSSSIVGIKINCGKRYT